MTQLFFEVFPLDNYILELFLLNGDIKKFDMTAYLKYPLFKPLQDINIFSTVRLDELGGVEWDYKNLSLSPDTLLAHMY